MRNKHDGPTLTIASGATASDELAENQLYGVRSIVIAAPDTLPETVKVAVSVDGGTSFKTLQSGGVDVDIPAGKAAVIDVGGFDGLRVEAGSAVGADRDFGTNLIEDIT